MNNIIGLSARESTLDGAARLGIEVVLDELYDIPLESVEEVIAKAKDAEADLFVSTTFLPGGVLTVQTMKALDYNPRFLVHGIGSIVPEWKEALGEDGYYVFSGTPIHPKLPFEGIEALNTVARTRFELSGAPPYFLFGYAWLQTLQAGVEGAGSLDQQAIQEYLRSHEIVTIGGTFSFDERGLPSPYSYLTQVQSTGVELIWPPEARTAEPVYPKPPWNQ